VSLEIVTVVADPTEVALLREHLVGRVTGIPLTVLVRPGVTLPPWDPGSVNAVPIGAGGVVERVLKDYAARARGPWLLQVDPDELWPEGAFRRAGELAGRLDRSEAAAFPMTYHVGSCRCGPVPGAVSTSSASTRPGRTPGRRGRSTCPPPPVGSSASGWPPPCSTSGSGTWARSAPRRTDTWHGGQHADGTLRSLPAEGGRAVRQEHRRRRGLRHPGGTGRSGSGWRPRWRYQWKANAAWRESRRRATSPPRRLPPSPAPRRARPRRGRR
jgi:hypothetical protein